MIVGSEAWLFRNDDHGTVGPQVTKRPQGRSRNRPHSSSSSSSSSSSIGDSGSSSSSSGGSSSSSSGGFNHHQQPNDPHRSSSSSIGDSSSSASSSGGGSSSSSSGGWDQIDSRLRESQRSGEGILPEGKSCHDYSITNACNSLLSFQFL